MWQKILTWIREVWQMISTSNVKQALNVEVVLSPAMADALQTWAAMYGNQSPWLANGMQSLNLAAGIATEIARAVTIEAEITISGSARAEFLQTQLAKAFEQLRPTTEYAAAKGGLMFKPYINNAGGITVDLVQADQFYPIAFDANKRMTACVFSDQKTIGGVYYTRLEYHALLQDGYHITNTAWRSTSKNALGNQVPLSSVAEWAELEPEAIIANVTAPLFSYFKMPFANNIDTTSPLGVSIYSRAIDLIKQADQQWTDFLWEFESGKRALYTDPMAFERDANNKPILPDRRLYRLLDLQGKIDKQGLFEEWTPTLREVQILNGLEAILRRIEFACGLSYGVISNPEAVALTATEIKAGKQRYYSTVTDIQKALQTSIDDLIYAMDVWVTLGNLAPAGTFTTQYWWDDSVVADHDTAFTQDLQVLGQVMSKVEFRMRNYGEDEATARKMIAMMDSERQPVSFFDGVNIGGV
jgi:A118 family predicted phage portal protein